MVNRRGGCAVMADSRADATAAFAAGYWLTVLAARQRLALQFPIGPFSSLFLGKWRANVHVSRSGQFDNGLRISNFGRYVNQPCCPVALSAQCERSAKEARGGEAPACVDPTRMPPETATRVRNQVICHY